MILDNLNRQAAFSESERAVVSFVLSHPEDVLTMSTRDLADASLSSPSTVVRMARKAGADGFEEFKLRLASELATSETLGAPLDANEPFAADDSSQDIARRILHLSRESLERTHRALDYRAINDVAGALNRRHSVSLYGEGDSLTVLDDFKSRLLRLGFDVFMEADHTLQAHHALSGPADSVPILVSYSGSNPRILQIASILQGRSIAFVAVTCEGGTQLGRKAAIRLEVPEVEGRMMSSKMSNFGSQVAERYLLDVLFSVTFSRSYERNAKVNAKGATRLSGEA